MGQRNSAQRHAGCRGNPARSHVPITPAQPPSVEPFRPSFAHDLVLLSLSSGHLGSCERWARVSRQCVGRRVERQHLNVMSSLSSLFIIYPPKLHSVSAAQHAGYADAIGGFATSTLLLTPPVRPTLLPDFASDACAVGMSHGARCRCSNALLPLHAAPGWAPACSRARHTPTLRQYTACLRCPFSAVPPRTHTVPPRSPAAQPVRPMRPGWAAWHVRATAYTPRRVLRDGAHGRGRPGVRPRSSHRVAPCRKHTAVRRVQVQPQCGGMWE